MFTHESIAKGIAQTLVDLGGFVNAFGVRQAKGTGIGYIVPNFVWFASGETETLGRGRHDEIVQRFAEACTDEQRQQVQNILEQIIEENTLNLARQELNFTPGSELFGKGFVYCNPYATTGSDAGWGSVMRALCKHFGVELPPA